MNTNTEDDRQDEAMRRVEDGMTPFDWAMREVERARLRRLNAGDRLVKVTPLKLPKFHPWGPEE